MDQAIGDIVTFINYSSFIMIYYHDYMISAEVVGDRGKLPAHSTVYTPGDKAYHVLGVSVV